jgi:hypothetical protein
MVFFLLGLVIVEEQYTDKEVQQEVTSDKDKHNEE